MNFSEKGFSELVFAKKRGDYYGVVIKYSEDYNYIQRLQDVCQQFDENDKDSFDFLFELISGDKLDIDDRKEDTSEEIPHAAQETQTNVSTVKRKRGRSKTNQ